MHHVTARRQIKKNKNTTIYTGTNGFTSLTDGRVRVHVVLDSTSLLPLPTLRHHHREISVIVRHVLKRYELLIYLVLFSSVHERAA